MIADSVVNTMVIECRNQLLEEQNKQNSTDCGKHEVVNHEKCIQLQGREFLHDFTTSEDDDIVCDQSSCTLSESRDGCLSFHESEILCWVTDANLEGFAEERP